MIERIKTENGERWAMVFDETYSLCDICIRTIGLTELLIDATSSELYHSAQGDFCSALEILRCLLPTPDQASQYEDYLKEHGLITS